VLWVRAFLGGSGVTVRARQKVPRRRTCTLWSDHLSTRPPFAVTVPLDPDAQPAVRLGRPLAGRAGVVRRAWPWGAGAEASASWLVGFWGRAAGGRRRGDLATATRAPDAGSQP
jgi:hypothetical protein